MTKREVEVLVRAATGATADEIAASLYLGGSTVRAHLTHLHEMLDVKGRVPLVAKAIHLGLLDAGPWPVVATGKRCIDRSELRRVG